MKRYSKHVGIDAVDNYTDLVILFFLLSFE